MTNPYYNPSGAPGTRAKLSSSPIRAELAAVGTGFDKLAPTLTANALLHVNAAGTQQVANANITVSAAGALAGITDLTTTGNTVLGNASTDTLNVGNGGLIKDSAGNVGIGTDAPSAKLTVAGNLLMSQRGPTNGAQWPDFRLYNTTGNSLVIDDYTNVFFAITSSGNIGIGTSSPTNFGAGYSALSIDGSTCGVLELMQAGASAFRVFCFPTEARLQVMLNVPMKFYTNNIIRGQFKAAGQLNLEPLASDPSGAEAGDLYFNSTTGKFRGYDGSSWADLN